MQIERITLNPAVMGGKPCIRGLRVTVGTILAKRPKATSSELLPRWATYVETRCRVSSLPS